MVPCILWFFEYNWMFHIFLNIQHTMLPFSCNDTLHPQNSWQSWRRRISSVAVDRREATKLPEVFVEE